MVAHDDRGPTPDHERRLFEVLQEYLQAVDEGRAPQRSALLAQHPDLADELHEFLQDQDCLRGLAEPLASFADEDLPTLGRADTPDAASETQREPGRPALPTARVRYFGDYELI